MPWWAPNANMTTSVSAVVWDFFGQGSLKSVEHDFFKCVDLFQISFFVPNDDK